MTKLKMDWLVSNIVVWFLAIVGTVYGATWALRVFTFLIWFYMFVWGVNWAGAEAFTGEKYAKLRKLLCSPTTQYLGVISDLGLACLVVAFGHWFIAIGVVLQMVCQLGFKARLEQLVPMPS